MALSLDSQRRMLAELHRLSAERETAERQMRAEFDTASARVQRELSDARQSAIMRFQMDRDSTQRQYDAAVVAANSICETRHEIVAKEQQQAATQAQNDAAKAQRRAKRCSAKKAGKPTPFTRPRITRRICNWNRKRASWPPHTMCCAKWWSARTGIWRCAA